MIVRSFQNLSPLSSNARRNCLASIFHARSGHPGGSLSVIDILMHLFHCELRSASQIRPQFTLSKGHAAPALYAVATEVGLLHRSELMSLRKIGGPLQGHPHVGTTPWVGTSTGSLGQGLSTAVGMALGYKHQGINLPVYTVAGDGEMQEGQVWEAAMTAAHHKLGDLCLIIDYNKLQSDDLNENIIGLEPLGDRWRAFNWNVIEIDGHCQEDIAKAIATFKSCVTRPTVIIAHTLKGKGVSFMEGVPAWHGSVTMSADELVRALRELGVSEAEIGSYVDGSFFAGGD